jgi:hypothetical protein
MRAIAGSACAALALVGVHLALGGATYEPARVADPCATRDWRGADDLQGVAEQIVLSALDGAACELGVTRERLVLAFADRDSLARFARAQGIGHAELETLVRSGLERAIDDAQEAGALDSTVARILRAVIRRVPVEELLELLRRLPL